MREVVFDTETTGLDPRQGDRIVELGCIELFNLLPTGREFQIYVNPGRPVSEATVRITGITNDMLRGKPNFAHPDVVDRLLEFIGDATLIAHNAEFDRNFLNHELSLLDKPPFPKERFVDTLVLAKEHRPGAPASLDAVCKRFNISIEGRELHGALKDARLLAMAYLELRGGRERAFDFATTVAVTTAVQKTTVVARPPRPQPLPSRLSEQERAAHAAFIAELGDAAVWKKFG